MSGAGWSSAVRLWLLLSIAILLFFISPLVRLLAEWPFGKPPQDAAHADY
jgi:hypothetical protein